jgi:uncharacterized protein YbbC (DUF1343 family)
VPQNLDGTPFVGRPQVASGGRVDAETRLPIFDLGGEKLDPASVRGLGALVFDLQDPGVRFFTVMGRLQQCMEAAAEAGIEFVVPVFVWAGPTALDDLVGTSRLRQLLEEESVGQILAADVAAIERFRKDRARFLLY